jgi:TonB family protein
MSESESFFAVQSMKLGNKMKFFRLFPFLLIGLFVAFGSSRALAQDEAAPQKDNPSQQAPQLKAIKEPMVPYPEEAEKKRIEGKATLTIVVDAEGRVSDAKVLSGPPELIQAALDSVKMWRYEPPKSAPVTKTVWVSPTVFLTKPCPGPVSGHGGCDDLGWASQRQRLASWCHR